MAFLSGLNGERLGRESPRRHLSRPPNRWGQSGGTGCVGSRRRPRTPAVGVWMQQGDKGGGSSGDANAYAEFEKYLQRDEDTKKKIFKRGELDPWVRRWGADALRQMNASGGSADAYAAFHRELRRREDIRPPAGSADVDTGPEDAATYENFEALLQQRYAPKQGVTEGVRWRRAQTLPGDGARRPSVSDEEHHLQTQVLRDVQGAMFDLTRLPDTAHTLLMVLQPRGAAREFARLLEQFHALFPLRSDEGVEVVAVCADRPTMNKKYVRHTGFRFALLSDEHRRFATRYCDNTHVHVVVFRRRPGTDTPTRWHWERSADAPDALSLFQAVCGYVRRPSSAAYANDPIRGSTSGAELRAPPARPAAGGGDAAAPEARAEPAALRPPPIRPPTSPPTTSPNAVPERPPAARVVLNHSTHIPGLIPLLHRLAEDPRIRKIVPGRLARAQGRSPTLSMRVTVPVRGGWKLVARKASQVQDVFVTMESADAAGAEHEGGTVDRADMEDMIQVAFKKYR
ncbi:hypothetical protein CDCA_CDCA01G0401 [Cyanidium caldarium]|uniref:Uncharacterized protein n=1 Tax=Cyanidium caldarium TaxID=2771 RepID=A0AAV9IQN1_CYACA|nr:hypothetical protein CDCA_CDCA01G0401 [Cyanidium caldarium]